MSGHAGTQGIRQARFSVLGNYPSYVIKVPCDESSWGQLLSVGFPKVEGFNPYTTIYNSTLPPFLPPPPHPPPPTPRPEPRIRRHCQKIRSNVTARSQDQTSPPEVKIGRHRRKPGSDVTAGSQDQTSPPEDKIRSRRRKPRSDVTARRQDQTSLPEAQIRSSWISKSPEVQSEC